MDSCTLYPQYEEILKTHAIAENGYMYIATPYTNYMFGVEAAYADAMEVSAQLFAWGFPNFSPIVHCHAMAKRYKLPTDAAYWKKYNEIMLDSACSLAVITMEGFNRSDGVAHEIEYAKTFAKPIAWLGVNYSGERLATINALDTHSLLLKLGKAHT